MRLLADENFPAEAVAALQARGHDVRWVRTDAPGSTDAEVLDRAVAEDRIILTLDKDFGELAYRSQPAVPPGIILLRIAPLSPAYVTRLAVAALESRVDWVGHFAVIEPARVRLVPLPKP